MDTSKRPSPSQHASQTPIGTKMVGNDGNMWIVGQDKNGTHRWVLLKKSGTPTRRTFPSSVSKGDLIMTKAGWEFYKKTLDDGRIVYTISKLNETAPNKNEWVNIKSELYLNTQFKWGKFGTFERWGQIASEQAIIKMAADILAKYYQGKSEDTAPIPEPKGKKVFDAKEIADSLLVMHSAAFRSLKIESGGDLYLSDDKQKLYAKFMDNAIQTYSKYDLKSLTEPYWISVGDLVEEENAHSLTNYLALRGYLGLESLLHYNELYEKYPKGVLNPANFRLFPESAPMTQFTIGDYFRKPEGIMIYLIDSYDNKEVFTSWRLKSKTKEGVTVFPIQDLIDGFAQGDYIFCDKDGVASEKKVKTKNKPSDTPKETPSEPQAATKEQLETAIKGLKILADKGNANAIAALKGLNYLLSKK